MTVSSLGCRTESVLRETATTRPTLGESISHRSTPSPTSPVPPKRRIFMTAMLGFLRIGYQAGSLRVHIGRDAHLPPALRLLRPRRLSLAGVLHGIAAEEKMSREVFAVRQPQDK